VIATTTNLQTCGICGGQAIPISKPFEGYVEGYFTAVLKCGTCQARFSCRKDIPVSLFEQIHAQAQWIPGYARYRRYEFEVIRHPSPREFLATEEEPYWQVRRYLDSLPNSQGVHVLELGCGAGYLTYALRTAGLDCVGVDISAQAIARARALYGHDDWFHPLDEFRPSGRAYDVVIALELIEHVPDPVAFIRDAVAMVKKGGAVIISTPDGDACRPGEIWASDTPHVHLYWLGRQALRAISHACGATIQFLNSPPSKDADTYQQPMNQLWPRHPNGERRCHLGGAQMRPI
jgi:2-polyprenyl-3-methyl-5-hydroxy-6-metoxy-1,4-benzoquinol methylase